VGSCTKSRTIIAKANVRVTALYSFFTQFMQKSFLLKARQQTCDTQSSDIRILTPWYM